MASTITVQDIVVSARSFPKYQPLLGVSGWEQEPALTFANEVMQRFLAENMNWKWNRSNAKPFYTIALQQDYIGCYPLNGVDPTTGNPSILDMAWLEQGWRRDINNTATPKPIFGMETVRDLGRTSYQANPFFISWIPVPLAFYGSWQASTAYPTGYGAASTPASPVQQFIDANGNYLFVSGNGTSGLSQPYAPTGATAGTTVSDNTVTWTVADPNGIAIRLSPLPGTSGICWEVTPVYQKKPPLITKLTQTISPIPDELGYLFRQGFYAKLDLHATGGSAASRESWQLWEEALIKALRSADREREDATLYPSESLMGGGPYKYGMPVGPSWPFNYWGQ